MTRQSPHKRWKGCCMMCGYLTLRGLGWAHKCEGRKSLLKEFGGRKRRIKRNDVPHKEDW